MSFADNKLILNELFNWGELFKYLTPSLDTQPINFSLTCRQLFGSIINNNNNNYWLKRRVAGWIWEGKLKQTATHFQFICIQTIINCLWKMMLSFQSFEFDNNPKQSGVLFDSWNFSQLQIFNYLFN